MRGENNTCRSRGDGTSPDPLRLFLMLKQTYIKKLEQFIPNLI
jgi:hypothetical protein